METSLILVNVSSVLKNLQTWHLAVFLEGWQESLLYSPLESINLMCCRHPKCSRTLLERSANLLSMKIYLKCRKYIYENALCKGINY